MSIPSATASQVLATSHPRLLQRLVQPRFLRALPTLMVLTTALVWATSSHAVGLGLDSALRNGVGLNATAGAGLGTGLGLGGDAGAAGSANAGGSLDARTGANSNITAEQRAAAWGTAGVRAGVDASGAVTGVGRAVGSVRDRGEGAARAAVQTGQRATQGAVNGGGRVGVQGNAGASVGGGGLGAGTALGAGVQGVVPTR